MILDACFHLDQSQVHKEIHVQLNPELWTLHTCLDKTLLDILFIFRMIKKDYIKGKKKIHVFSLFDLVSQEPF